MDDRLAGEAAKLATQAQDLATNLKGVAQQITDMARAGHVAVPDGHMPFVSLLTIFALACFVGYYVVWRVTPALHSPLMAVTNAVSSVIIVGALLAAGLKGLGAAQLFGAIAVALPPSTSSAASSSRTACCRCSRRSRSRSRRAGDCKDDHPGTGRLRLSDRGDLLHHGAARALSSPVTSRQGNLLRHRRHGGGDRRHRRHRRAWSRRG